MLINGTDVASWASPRLRNSEAERKKICARLKLMEVARAVALETDNSLANRKQLSVADVVIEVRAPPPDRHDGVSWLDQLYGIAKFRNQAIGRLDAKLIRRNQFLGSFAEVMEGPSEGTAKMALDLFDRYGRLRPEFLEHPFKKGSGIWGDELGSGNLLLLDEVTVNEAYRREGIVTKLVETVIQACRVRPDVFFALVHPGVLSTKANKQIARLHEQVNMDSAAEREAFNDLVQHINTTLEVKATKFWRSVGFRRVGSSSWFALTSDASHPAHTLPAEKDFELPDVAQRGTLATLCAPNGVLNLKARNCSTILDDVSHIFGSLSIQDARWYSTTSQGETILHVAARRQDASVISW